MKANSKEIIEKITTEGIILKGSAMFFKNNFTALPGELYLSSKRLIFTQNVTRNYISTAGAAGAVMLFGNSMRAPLMPGLAVLAILYVVIFSLIRFMKPGKQKAAYDIEMNSVKVFSRESTGRKKFMVIALNDGSVIKFLMGDTEEWDYVIRKLVRASV